MGEPWIEVGKPLDRRAEGISNYLPHPTVIEGCRGSITTRQMGASRGQVEGEWPGVNTLRQLRCRALGIVSFPWSLENEGILALSTRRLTQGDLETDP